ncbi:DUF924 family protein [Microcoleus sp. Pol11C3]|uniref:DUF924 family protein n=1 Tax=Microcoleus sp. Pol11C3 TaxID=3055390 RepID=UPI002FD28C45
MVNHQEIQQDLINYMFRRDDAGKLDGMRCLTLWFGKSQDTDNQIRKQYGDLVSSAIAGKLDHWMETPRGCVALMILLDQFPRNLYRHTVHMYDGDKKAMQIVDRGHNWQESLTPEECLFVPCLILTHQENLDGQKQCVSYYEKIEPHLHSEFRIFRTIFEEHLKIINICGVFPHRDHYYGRETSEAGRMLMEDSTLRFDLPLIAENGSVRFGTDSSRLWKATGHVFDVLERLDYLSTQRQAGVANSLNIDWMSDEQMAFCKDTFRKFDKDGSNSMSSQELGSVLKAVGRPYSPQRVQEAMDIITGRSNSESISFEEFATLLESDLMDDRDKRLLERFKLFDVDGSGEISLEELKICIRSLDSLVTSAEIDDMLKRADTSGDGQVSYKEFYELFHTLKSQAGEASL